MTPREHLACALRDLEADLSSYCIPGSALITLGEDVGSPELREVYRAVVGLQHRLPVYANDYDMYKIPDTGHAVFAIRLTGMVYIQTLVGKLVLPQGMGLSILGKF
jgi:hypothetical protein